MFTCIVTISGAFQSLNSYFYLIFFFWTKDFLQHFLYWKSVVDQFFMLLHVWNSLYFVFVLKDIFAGFGITYLPSPTPLPLGIPITYILGCLKLSYKSLRPSLKNSGFFFFEEHFGWFLLLCLWIHRSFPLQWLICR